MAHHIQHVANAFLKKDFSDNKASITPLKMQKLIFFLNGWHLAITGEPAIETEFRAWKYGPVEEQLYHDLKGYRGNPITAYLSDSDGRSRTIADSQKMFYDILNMVWDKYSGFSAIQLSALTHEPGTPWDQVYNHTSTPTISNKITKKYFLEKLTHERRRIFE